MAPQGLTLDILGETASPTLDQVETVKILPRKAILAPATSPTLAYGFQCNPVADRPALDAGADFNDLARDFVAGREVLRPIHIT